MPLNIKPSSGSGSVTISATTGTTTNDTLTLPAKTGNIITSADSGTVTGTMLASATVAQSNIATNVVGNGPAFVAYQSVAQSISNSAYTKVTFDTEVYDTNNNFASSRFTPTVAGYYQVSAGLQVAATTTNQIVIFKNGGAYSYGINTSSLSYATNTMSCLVYCNGSTDYIEVYGLFGATNNTSPSISTVYFQGALVRSA